VTLEDFCGLSNTKLRKNIRIREIKYKVIKEGFARKYQTAL